MVPVVYTFCGARECGAYRKFYLEARACMLALRIANFSSEGAFARDAQHLEDFQQWQAVGDPWRSDSPFGLRWKVELAVCRCVD
jgi:hypothetical protein